MSIHKQTKRASDLQDGERVKLGKEIRTVRHAYFGGAAIRKGIEWADKPGEIETMPAETRFFLAPDPEPAEDSLTTWEREQVRSGKAVRDGNGIKLVNPDMVSPPASESMSALDRAVLAHRSNPTDANRDALLAAQREHSERFHARMADEYVAQQSSEPEIPSAPRNHPDYVPRGAVGENYARTDSGELIGPYASAEECERERIAANAENEPAIERDADGRPIGKCPDCGKPITLQRSGWWTHDGLAGDCWHQSMDGPNDLDTTEPDDHDSPLFLTFKRESGQTISHSVDDIATDIEILRDGSTRINATGAALRQWANEPTALWPCSELTQLRSLHVKLAPNGDLVELSCDPEYKAGGERSEPSADELDTFIASALRAKVISDAIEIEPECLEGIDGPGKFENTDRELAAAMYAIAGHGAEDERAGDVESTGAAWRVDRFVAVEDSQGFVSAEGFRSVPDAEKYAQSFDVPEDDESSEDESAEPATGIRRSESHPFASGIPGDPRNTPEPVEPAPIERTIRRTLTRDLPNGSRIVANVELRKDGDRGLSGGFSVTGELYEKHGTWSGAAQQKNEREPDACGCIHDELSKAFPKLAPIIALHLSAEDGTPMHAEANARYWHEQSAGIIPIGETYGRENERGETRAQYCRRLACKTLRVESLPADLDRDAQSVRELMSGTNPDDIAGGHAVYVAAFASFVNAQRDRWKTEAIEARKLIESLPED